MSILRTLFANGLFNYGGITKHTHDGARCAEFGVCLAHEKTVGSTVYSQLSRAKISYAVENSNY